MSWLELMLETDASDSALLEEILYAQDAQALTLHDAGDEPVLEPLPGETPLWSRVRITALFDADIDQTQVIRAMRTAMPELIYQWQPLADQPWERTWLDRFKPRRFGQRLWVIPTGSEVVSDEGAVSLLLDPGLAFGTGDHPTTELCLRWLDRTDLANQTVLDYGHGSGILAIAAMKLGAASALGMDIDPQAVTAGNNNAQRNKIGENIHFTTQTVSGQYDVVVANILAGPLTELASRISGHVKKGGKIALSGILHTQVEDVLEAYRPWITWAPVEQLDDWVMLHGVRNSRLAE